jgi:hypothetical protein
MDEEEKALFRSIGERLESARFRHSTRASGTSSGRITGMARL